MEVERRFSLAKRKCGMGLVTAKLRETAAHVIAMSVLVLNLRKIQCALLRMLTYLLEILAQKKNWTLVQWTLIRHALDTLAKCPFRCGKDASAPISCYALERIHVLTSGVMILWHLKGSVWGRGYSC